MLASVSRSSGECCRIGGPRRGEVRSFLLFSLGRFNSTIGPRIFRCPLRRCSNSRFLARGADGQRLRSESRPARAIGTSINRAENWALVPSCTREDHQAHRASDAPLPENSGCCGTNAHSPCHNRSPQVHCHRHAKFLRHVADLVRLENSAGRCKSDGSCRRRGFRTAPKRFLK